jgi:hypothetical protein
LGGSGSTPGIDDVLSVNQILTSNQIIDTGGFNLEINSALSTAMVDFDGTSQIVKFGNNVGSLFTEIDCVNNSPKIYFSDNNVFRAIHSNKNVQLGDIVAGAISVGFFVDGTNGIVSIKNADVTNGFICDFFNDVFYLGDNAVQNNGNTFFIDDNNNTISLKNNGNTDGLSFDMANQVYDIGNLTTNLTGFRIDDGNQIITAQTASGQNGLKLDFNSSNRFYAFGDFAGLSNSTKLLLDDLNTIATLRADAEIIFDTQKLNFPDPNIETTSASGNSGNHLKVTVNGVDYVIELKNP